MKRGTKIFITCLVVGMWLLNLSAMNISKASRISDYFNMSVGAVGMIAAGLLLTYPIFKEEENGTD